VFHGVFFISLRGIAANHGMFRLATWHVFLSKRTKRQSGICSFVLLSEKCDEEICLLVPKTP
jgi:hypothetical protein